MTDVSTWVKRWQAGDERAAELLYNRFREATFRLAIGLLGDVAEAEETAQEALAYALLNIKRYDANRAKFSTWLHTITVSRCRDRYRRRRLPSLSLNGWFGKGGDVVDTSPGPEELAMTTETHSQVWQAVQELDPILREAIVLRYWAGHTYKEIGEILGCPLRTAQSRVRLGFEKLQVELGGLELNGLGGETVP